MSSPFQDVVVRTATPADASDVVDIYVESWNEGFGARMPHMAVSPSRLSSWRQDLDSKTPTRWWLAEHHGSAVGFVGIRPCRDPCDPALGELDTIAVRPSAWRAGIGRQLMSVALNALRAEGYETAVLWTLNEYRCGESFYVASGWQRTDTLRQSGEQIRYDCQLRTTQ